MQSQAGVTAECHWLESQNKNKRMKMIGHELEMVVSEKTVVSLRDNPITSACRGDML